MNPTSRNFIIWTVTAALALAATNLSAAEPILDWAKQFGTVEHDGLRSVSTDGLGYVYVAGQTAGDLAGPNVGSDDVFLSKYDDEGTLVWDQQWGTEHTDYPRDMVSDDQGRTYVTYSTSQGELGIEYSLRSYDPSGSLLSSQPIPHTGSIALDDSDNIFISGWGTDGFGVGSLSKYEPNGTLLWTREQALGSEGRFRGVSVDSHGNSYVSPIHQVRLPSGLLVVRDAYLSKYDPSGELLWTQEVAATPFSDVINDVLVDDHDNIYFTGSTNGSLARDNPEREECECRYEQVIFGKYDSEGTLLWIQQWESHDWMDRGESLTSDAEGNIFVAGTTQGSLGGEHAGGVDVWLTKHDPSGELLWSQQWGTEGSERSNGIATHGDSVYLASSTAWQPGATTKSDAVLLKYTEKPSLLGDFDENGELDAFDIDLLSTLVREGVYDASFDLNSDMSLDGEDRRIWVEDLAGTFFGDADLDRIVDFADFLILSAGYGDSGGWGMGDFDGSADIQFADFLKLSENFGSSAAIASVPEPKDCNVLLLGVIGLLYRAKVKRR